MESSWMPFRAGMERPLAAVNGNRAPFLMVDAAAGRDGPYTLYHSPFTASRPALPGGHGIGEPHCDGGVHRQHESTSFDSVSSGALSSWDGMGHNMMKSFSSQFTAAWGQPPSITGSNFSELDTNPSPTCSIGGLRAFDEWDAQAQADMMETLHGAAVTALDVGPGGGGEPALDVGPGGGGEQRKTRQRRSRSKASVDNNNVLRKNNRPKHNHSKEIKEAMRGWIQANMHDPYPDDSVKASFARMGGLTPRQVTAFFINERKRSPLFAKGPKAQGAA